MVTNITEAKINGNLIVKHLIQIKNGITKHVTVSVKIIISAKKITVGILAHALLKIVMI